ncbi:MAG: HNH endonuclease signature motif containing protein [Roseococcus sp.]
MARSTSQTSTSMSAGKKSAQTKGADELSRAGKMAAWTRLNGKNDAENPHSKANYGAVPPMRGTDDPFPTLDPIEVEEQRQETLRVIRLREGQGEFRGGLLKAYGSACCVTGCEEELVLEAAHIIPFDGPETNGLTNGLLLRADIHTMLDKDLLTFDAERWPPQILVKQSVTDAFYRSLHGTVLRPPIDPTYAPMRDALKWRRRRCGW